MAETIQRANRAASAATGVKGKDYLISIDDGSGGMLEVEYQDDSTYSSGKSGDSKRTKNGSLPFQTEAGATVTFSFVKLRPMSAAHTRIYTVFDSGAVVPVIYQDKKTGGHKRTGNAQVTITDETANTEGLMEVSVTLAFQDDPTETVVT